MNHPLFAGTEVTLTKNAVRWYLDNAYDINVAPNGTMRKDDEEDCDNIVCMMMAHLMGEPMKGSVVADREHQSDEECYLVKLEVGDMSRTQLLSKSDLVVTKHADPYSIRIADLKEETADLKAVLDAAEHALFLQTKAYKILNDVFKETRMREQKIYDNYTNAKEEIKNLRFEIEAIKKTVPKKQKFTLFGLLK